MRMTAAVADVGSPIVSSGTSTPAAAALLAASGPGDALDRAVPELLGVLGQLLLRRVAQEGRHLRAAGGQAPIGNPNAVPRSQAGQERRKS